MATATDPAIGLPGTTLPSLALDTSESTYTFTAAGRTKADRKVIVWCDQDMLVAYPTNDNYVAIPANSPYPVRLRATDVILYAKVPTGTGNMFAVLKDDQN